MFKILAEQFELAAHRGDEVGAPGLLILEVQCYSAMPVPNPSNPMGPPIGQIAVPSVQVQIPLDARERAKLRAVLATMDDQVADAADVADPLMGGEEQGDLEFQRCGRLQRHPAHTYPSGGSTMWCDGQSSLTDIGAEATPTDDLPEPTRFEGGDAGWPTPGMESEAEEG